MEDASLTMAGSVGREGDGVMFLFFPREILFPIIQETPIGELPLKEFVPGNLAISWGPHNGGTHFSNSFAIGTASESEIHFPWKRRKVLRATQDLQARMSSFNAAKDSILRTGIRKDNFSESTTRPGTRVL